MKRLAYTAIALGLTTAVAACGSDDKKSSGSTSAASKGCPKQAANDSSYSSRFEGAVSMDDSRHVLRVTRDGKPVSGARVCVNTAMVGMKSMHYTASGRELAPGKYEVGVKFGMQGEYRGNVVTKEAGKEVSIPVNVKVGSHAMKDDAKNSGGAMKDHMKSNGAKKSDGAMKDGMKSYGK